MDELLRELITDISGANEVIWILLQGQSSEWLSETCKSILHERDPYCRRWPESHHANVLELLNKLSRHRVIRNAVIHGVWYPYDPFTEDDLLPRPWGARDDGSPVYYCTRSRYRKIDEARELSVGDVAVLADEIADVQSRLIFEFKAMKKHSNPNAGEAFKRWSS
ncbi:hypothetical protein [Streptomyces albipurpureus]|uniref:Uncharacterized protein n=1 Tax=Streptomyces albipurpureus TaxID=2897419 RepID=A0ABT0UYX4_9ACTN|nr:hypothetical protein [Streptomyces sp. CWNU-1]MCM2392513.1 hypothetical protein [Streptomyces sp. CWNU-1]